MAASSSGEILLLGMCEKWPEDRTILLDGQQERVRRLQAEGGGGGGCGGGYLKSAKAGATRLPNLLLTAPQLSSSSSLHC